MKKLAFALALTAAATTAMAQSGATLGTVEGLVTVTTGDRLVNAAPNMVIPENARVLTTANGKVMIKFPSGCVAMLGNGQALTATEANCRAFVAANGGPAAPGAGGGSFFASNWVWIGGAGVGALAYNVDRNRKNNNGATVVTPPVSGETPAVVVTPTPPNRPISNS